VAGQSTGFPFWLNEADISARESWLTRRPMRSTGFSRPRTATSSTRESRGASHGLVRDRPAGGPYRVGRPIPLAPTRARSAAVCQDSSRREELQTILSSLENLPTVQATAAATASGTTSTSTPTRTCGCEPVCRRAGTSRARDDDPGILSEYGVPVARRAPAGGARPPRQHRRPPWRCPEIEPGSSRPRSWPASRAIYQFRIMAEGKTFRAASSPGSKR